MTDQTTDPDLTRRMVLRSAAVTGAAVPFLAACGGGDSASGSGDSGSSDDKSASGGSGSSGSSGSSSSSSGGLAESDVPVGGGTVIKAQKVVVTQPEKGTYKAFSAVCTHQGCLVNKVEAKEIVCPCHGSHFSITDGSPTSGPAPTALESKTVTVKGGKITVT